MPERLKDAVGRVRAEVASIQALRDERDRAVDLMHQTEQSLVAVQKEAREWRSKAIALATEIDDATCRLQAMQGRALMDALSRELGRLAATAEWGPLADAEKSRAELVSDLLRVVTEQSGS